MPAEASIPCSKDTRELVKQAKQPGESYDDVLQRKFDDDVTLSVGVHAEDAREELERLREVAERAAEAVEDVEAARSGDGVDVEVMREAAKDGAREAIEEREHR